LIARSSVFEGYVAQYELLEGQKMIPSEFEHQLAQLPGADAIEGYLVLEPQPV
jgi:hypothetical protein